MLCCGTYLISNLALLGFYVRLSIISISSSDCKNILSARDSISADFSTSKSISLGVTIIFSIGASAYSKKLFASITVGIPTAIMGMPIVFLLNSLRELLTPAPGQMPLSHICIACAVVSLY